ncbi:MAG TPA: MFS transporter [Polyangiaceae bacterium]|nr:MFS transporter [Polyangiaceae bacterium]
MSDRPPRRAAAALGYRDFRLFQVGRFTAVVGTQMLSVAVGWQVYDLTRRPLDLGYVGLAQFLPGFVLALPAGHVADRADRRRIVALCQAVYVLVAAALIAFVETGASSPALIYALLVAFGAARGFSGPAGQALMPDLVPGEHFANAVAWGSSAWQVATIVGPAAGGVAYAAGGPTLAYGLGAALFVVSVVATLAIRTVPSRSKEEGASWASLLAGVRFVFAKKIILGALTLDLFAVLLGGATALLPVYARDVLHVGPTGLGVLRAAPGFGAALMAIGLAYRPLGGRAGGTLFACVLIFGVATIAFGASRSFPLSLAALVTLGAADLVSVVVRHTVVQLSTPPEMRGRVSAVNVVFIGASNELGEFESGVTAALLGTVPAVVLGGVGTCFVVLVSLFLFPELRRVDRLEPGAI